MPPALSTPSFTAGAVGAQGTDRVEPSLVRVACAAPVASAPAITLSGTSVANDERHQRDPELR
jgi:hypothetical protein